jgi:integrase
MTAIIALHQTSKWAKRDNQPPVRQCNKHSRTREYLTAEEVERMITAARRVEGRLAERDALLVMMAYRHGFRASELIALRWDQIDLKAGTIHVARLKHGSASTHPLRGPKLRALRAWKREQGEDTVRIHLATWPRPPASSFRSIRICFGMRPAFISPTLVRIPAQFSFTSGTGTFSTLCGIRS